MTFRMTLPSMERSIESGNIPLLMVDNLIEGKQMFMLLYWRIAEGSHSGLVRAPAKRLP